MSRHEDPEYTWEESDEVVELEVARPLDKVIPVRLASDKWELLRREAQELGLGPSTLVRMWVLEKLRSLPAPGPKRVPAAGAAGARRSARPTAKGRSARPG